MYVFALLVGKTSFIYSVSLDTIFGCLPKIKT